MRIVWSNRNGAPRQIRSAFGSRLVLAGLLGCAFLQTTTPGSAEESKKISGVKGPATITLGDHLATVKMPAQDVFIDADSAKAILKSEGSPTEGVLGLFASQKKGAGWMVLVSYQDIGYVKDDDAEKLNADEILNSYKENTNAANEERKEKGIPPYYVGGWAEKPRYQKDKHEVVWAVQVKDQDKAEAPVAAVNYNTRVLGRRGVLSMNLVTSPDALEANKPSALALLDQTTFAKGESYADYQPGKDKSSGYGLAGLILGGGALAAAAKFGILGAAGKWLIGIVLVLKKFIILLIAGIGAALNKMFGKKKSAGVAAPPQTPSAGPPGPPSMP